MARAWALTGLSGAFEDWAAAANAVATRHESKRMRRRVIDFVCQRRMREQATNCIGRSTKKKARAEQGNLAERQKSSLDASWQRILRVDHGLWQTDGFEAGSNFQIELEVPVACGMISGCGLFIETLPGHIFGAYAFQNAPTLVPGSGCVHD